MLKFLHSICALSSKSLCHAFCVLSALAMAQQSIAQDIQITEIWSGNAAGDDLSADWFEIKNMGSTTWTSATPLFYDDDSSDPGKASEVFGLTELAAGEVAIIVIGGSTDSLDFATLWDSELDLDGFEIGYTDGPGLGGGGDAVTLWIGDPNTDGTLSDFAEYPDTDGNGGKSYDVNLWAFSFVGNAAGAVATTETTEGEPCIASPGTAPTPIPEPLTATDFEITEIWSGNGSGENLSADWFEIKNTGKGTWTSEHAAFYYDDESADPTDATIINGLTQLAPDQVAIVVIGESTDSADFVTLWQEEVDFSNTPVGYTNGAGLGGSGDAVALWLGDPNADGKSADLESYPDTDGNGGKSYDILTSQFSEVANGAISTIELNDADESAIASPGSFLTPTLNPVNASDLRITEIWSGNEAGENLSEDWFEIQNTGSNDWTNNHPALYYDDDSSEPTDAAIISGIDTISAGGTAIVVLGSQVDAESFIALWSDETGIDFSGVAIGYCEDGKGLGAGGDAVTLWLGNPNENGELSDYEEYPDTEGNGGKSYDAVLKVFSEVGNLAGAVATTETSNSEEEPITMEPAIASPGMVAERTGGVATEISSDIQNKSVAVAEAISMTFASNFTDPDSDLVFEVSGPRGESLPTGLVFQNDTLSGSVSKAGYYTLKVTATEDTDVEPYSVSAFFGLTVAYPQTNVLEQLSTIRLGTFGEGAAEISAYDTAAAKLFVTNAETKMIDIVDLSDPAAIKKISSIDVSAYGDGVTSVAVANGLLVAAVAAEITQDSGMVVAFSTSGNLTTPDWTVKVGALPDMVTFNNDGSKVLTANEGEPSGNYSNDPEGSVSIIDVASKSLEFSADFNAFDGMETELAAKGIRIFGPNATVSQDLEPEYIAVIGDSAFVSCQENNAIAIIQISTGVVKDLIGLGYKDHSIAGNGLDVPFDEETIYITTMPFKGAYMPDAISAFQKDGKSYLLTANEGDAREYDGFEEESEIGDLPLDPDTFGNIEEIEKYAAGLGVTMYPADTTDEGLYKSIYTFGSRSFSIWNTDGTQVFDSGDDFEQITAVAYPEYFNSSDGEYELKDRSDNKGPEPEAITYGQVADKTYAFIGLERMGGIMVYDITDPTAAQFVEYFNNRDFDADIKSDSSGDHAPEGLVFIPEAASPINRNLLVVANEVSGSVTVYAVGPEIIEEEEEEEEALASEIKSLFMVYPNPTADQIIFENSGYENAQVFSVNGQLIRDINIVNQNSLDLSWANSGTYLIRFTGSQSGTLVKRVVRK